MNEEQASIVYPVLQQGLRLRAQVDRGEIPDRESDLHKFLEQEQAKLRGLRGLVPVRRRAEDTLGGSDPFLGIAYSLACWLDEIFILNSCPTNVSEWWSEHKLEWSLFRSDVRAEKFWEQARLAESQGKTNELEVFFLCTMLGFRGVLRNKPADLKTWRDAVEEQIAGARDEYNRPAPLEPPVNIPPLLGAGRKLKMLIWAAVSVLILTPAVAFLLIMFVFPRN
jgi:type VI secretion system protein ImpK